MNLADDMRANKTRAAEYKVHKKATQRAAASQFASDLDRYVPEVAAALSQAGVKKTWTRHIIERGWLCSAFWYNDHALVIYPNGRWAFGHPRKFTKKSRREVSIKSVTAMPSNQVRERLHTWAKQQA